MIAEYESGRDHYTLTLGSQGSHAIRDVIGVQVMGLAPEQMRVITPDVGGGFGTKLFAYREYALAAVAAKLTGKPVKWVADRTEHFLGDTHGRDNITTARLALDADGRFLALDVDTIADMGAYLSTYAPYIPYIGAAMLPGVYDIPDCFVRVRAAYTNTVPVDAYRGAGRPEASYVIERLVDAAAREIGVAPDAMRRRNFISPAQMPYATATGKTYDTGEFDGQMSRALDLAGWNGFEARAAEARSRGVLRGVGIATYIEACGGNGPDTATISLDKDGTIRLHVGTQTTGQGHDTSFSQIIADHLSVPPEQVRMLQGDTLQIATGTGTGGSSSIPAGGNSVAMAAAKLADQLKDVAADALEAAPRDLEFSDGAIRVAGTDRVIVARGARRTSGRDPGQAQRRGRVRSEGADLSEWHACRRDRDRRGDRADRHCELRDRRRFRRVAEPAAAGGPGAWRHGSGNRSGPDGKHRLRYRFRPAHHRKPDGLCAAAGRRHARFHIRDAQCALQGQSARREGRGRSRGDRLLSGGDECGGRRACGVVIG